MIIWKVNKADFKNVEEWIDTIMDIIKYKKYVISSLASFENILDIMEKDRKPDGKND